MTTFNIDSVCHIISNAYATFEGHRCSPGCANVRVFSTIMRMVDFMQANKAVRSCSFAVTRNNGSSEPVLLTIEYHGCPVSSSKAFSLVEEAK